MHNHLDTAILQGRQASSTQSEESISSSHEDIAVPGIFVVGLGPGDWSDLTLGALDCLLSAPRIIFRTLVHPTIAPLRTRLNEGTVIQSFDAEYEHAISFDSLYETIVATLLEAALQAEYPIVYAVPGHPLVGERSVHLLRAKAATCGVSVAIIDGLSFFEPLITAIQIDPLADGLQLVDGAALLDSPDITPWSAQSARLLHTGRPLVIGQVYDRRVASACKLWLLERYPPDHELVIVTGAGSREEQHRTCTLATLDHTLSFDHLTSLYIPALETLDDTRAQTILPFLVARLRAPDGCPWDRKQTLQTLTPYLIEETYEAVSALDAQDLDAFAAELGDILLVVTMLAHIAEEAGSFDLPQIVVMITEKIVTRHPHVFGSAALEDRNPDAVLAQWERLKARERPADASVLSDLPSALPALLAAQGLQRRAATYGFDWPTIDAVYEKVLEELQEVRTAASDAVLEEVGDLFFALVSLCRHLQLDAEEAVRKATAKFRQRFHSVERLCRERSLDLKRLDAATLDLLWEEAKNLPV